VCHLALHVHRTPRVHLERPSVASNQLHTLTPHPHPSTHGQGWWEAVDRYWRSLGRHCRRQMTNLPLYSYPKPALAEPRPVPQKSSQQVRGWGRENTLFPTVPGTQYPGRMIMLRSTCAHILNTSSDMPVCNCENSPPPPAQLSTCCDPQALARRCMHHARHRGSLPCRGTRRERRDQGARCRSDRTAARA
jgi:hypothetical protein